MPNDVLFSTTACPTSSGSPCADPSSQECYDCWGAAIDTGACKTTNDTCQADG